MRQFKIYCFITIFFIGCIEPYEFTVKNNNPTLVVEGFISNVSFNESLNFPSDGRYFTVYLRYTSDVINKKDEVVKNAVVYLLNDWGKSGTIQNLYLTPGNIYW
jgi:hypothetical protein